MLPPGWSQTANSSIRLANAVEAARLSRRSPRERIIALPTAARSIPRRVPGAVNSPVAGQGGHRAEMMINGQFGGGFKGLPDGLLSGVQQLVHFLVVSEMLASIR